MAEWLTAEEVSELTGQALRTIQWKAQGGKYITRLEKNTLGGGAGGMTVKIALASLNSDAQVEYMRRRGLIRDLAPATEPDGWDQAPAWKRAIAAKRLDIIREADRYLSQGGKKTEALKEFAAMWNATNDDGERVSDKTIYRWKKLYREFGRCGLLPDWGKREGRQSIDPRAREYFKKLYLQQSQPSVRSCRQELVEVCDEQGWPIPTLSALERFVASLPKPALVLAREGPEAFRNKCLPYIERDPDSIAGNQVWVSDHHEFDVMVKGPNGRPMRPWLTAWVCMRSWKLVGWHVGLSPNTDTIMASFASAALDRNIGLPREIYTDNGRDYCSHEIAGTGHRSKAKETQEDKDRRVRTLVETLDITPHFAIPKNARAKIAERVFGVVAEYWSKRWPTYTGRNTSEKPEQLKEVLAKPEQIPDFKEFKEKFDAWVRLVYNKMESTGKGRKGECPDETFERTRGPIRLASPEALRLCLMRHTQMVKVGRHGVTLFGQNYYNTELMVHQGKQVYLRYRDEDMAEVLVFDLNDRWLCNAQLKTALHATKADKEAMRQAKTEEKKAKRITQEYLQISQEVAAMPNPLDRVLAKKAASEPAKQPKVVEMARLNQNFRESAAAIAASQAVGQNTAWISDIISHTKPTQPAEERRISAGDVLRILNKPK